MYYSICRVNLRNVGEKGKVRLIKEGGGNKAKLSEEEQIILMLVYLRHYLSFQLLGIMFKISESSAHNIFNYWGTNLRRDTLWGRLFRLW